MWFPIKVSQATAAERQVPFVLLDAADQKNFLANHVFEVGDIKIAKDGGAFINLTSGQIANISIHGKGYLWQMLQADVNFSWARLEIVDQTNPKAFSDVTYLIVTDAQFS